MFRIDSTGTEGLKIVIKRFRGKKFIDKAAKVHSHEGTPEEKNTFSVNSVGSGNKPLLKIVGPCELLKNYPA